MAGKAKRRKREREQLEVTAARAQFERLAQAMKEKAEEKKFFDKAVEVGEEAGFTPIEVALILRTKRRIATRAMMKTKRRKKA